MSDTTPTPAPSNPPRTAADDTHSLVVQRSVRDTRVRGSRVGVIPAAAKLAGFDFGVRTDRDAVRPG